LSYRGNTKGNGVYGSRYCAMRKIYSERGGRTRCSPLGDRL
jgi:hypothetical protein